MDSNELLKQLGGEANQELVSYFEDLKKESGDLVKDYASRITKYSARLAKGEIDKEGYLSRMKDLQSEWKVKAAAQQLETQIRWQKLADKAIDLVAKFVISKITGL